MAEIINIAEFYLLSLALGIGLFTWIAKSELTGPGFQKLINTVCFVSLFVATIIHLTYGTFFDPVSLNYYAALISFLLIGQFHQDKKSLFMWTLFIVHNVCLLIALWHFQNHAGVYFLFSLSSALLLGIITYAMVLGHYYLVVPHLSVTPLKISIIFMWIMLVIKMVWSSGEIMENMKYFEEGTRLGGGYAFNWMMLIMRSVWGYLVVGVMSIFTWKLVKLRSTQSATGILYAMTIFVFIGELVSNYLFFKFGLLI